MPTPPRKLGTSPVRFATGEEQTLLTGQFLHQRLLVIDLVQRLKDGG